MQTEKITYHEFLSLVQKAWLNKQGEWRYGQTLFNALAHYRPDLSEQIRTTPLDPFFRDHENIKPALWAFLMRSW